MEALDSDSNELGRSGSEQILSSVRSSSCSPRVSMTLVAMSPKAK